MLSSSRNYTTISSINTTIGGAHGYTAISYTPTNDPVYNTMTQYIDHADIGKDVSSIAGCHNTISKATSSCHIIGDNNSIPTGANKCIIIGENIQLKECNQLHEAIYVGGDSKVFVKINGEFVDIVERLSSLEEKVNMLLYMPGGPMYQVAKQSFESRV